MYTSAPCERQLHWADPEALEVSQLSGGCRMAENSNIGWTDHTHNFWWGCNKVSEECTFCYIAPIMKRAGYEPFKGPMRTKNWDNPLRWNRAADKACRRA